MAKDKLKELEQERLDNAPDLFINWETVMPVMMSPEVAAAEYVKQHLLMQSPWQAQLRRLDKGDDRWYCYTDENTDEVIYLMSVTTFCDKSMPMGYGLKNYLLDNAKEATDLHKYWTAEYGTFFHIEAAEYLTNGSYSFGADGIIANRKLGLYMADKNIPLKLAPFFLRRFHKDMAALHQFIIDKNVEILAVEFPLMSYEFPLAGMADLVCRMDFNGSRVTALVDLKTGHVNTDSHPLQLFAYRAIWNEHMAETEAVTHVFNWAPNDWRLKAGEVKPTYKLKNQTNETVDFFGRIDTAKTEGLFNKAPSLDFKMGGVLNLGDKIENAAEIYDINRYYRDFLKQEQNASS